MDHCLTVGWRVLAVRLSGPADGYPVFFLHGTPGTRLDVRVADSDLEAIGVRLISYDRPGYGLSDPYPDRAVAQAADDVRVIADAFDLDEFAVLGRSGGGPHALAVAALLADRVSRAASIVGLAPYGHPDLDWLAGMTERNRLVYSAAITGKAALQRLVQPEVVAMRDNPGTFQTRWFSQAPDSDRQLAGRHLDVDQLRHAVARTSHGWMADHLAFTRPWGFDPAEISVPTLLWHGLRDVFAPVAHARWLGARIRTATLVLAEQGSHLQAAAVQVDTLRWLVTGGTPSITAA